MYFILMIVFIVGTVLVMTGCTDTDRASILAYGSSGHITCYSGNNVIFDGIPTGRIQTVKHSDGWEFKDAKTNKFIRVSGPCVIQN